MPERLTDNGLAVRAGTVGGLTGGVVANNIFPKTVEIVPGFRVQEKLSTSDGLHVDFVAGKFNAPEIDTPVPFVDGIAARIVEFDPTAGSGKYSGQYASILSDVNEALVSPATEALASHIRQGAVIGVVGGAMISRYLSYRRAIKQYNIEQAIVDNEITRSSADEHNDADLRSVANRGEAAIKSEKNKWFSRGKKRMLGAMASLALVGGNVALVAIDSPNPKDSADSIALTPLITETVPELQDATVEGIGGLLFNTGIRKVVLDKRQIDRDIDTTTTNSIVAITQYQASEVLDDTIDSDSLRVAVMSDTHCDAPFIRNTLTAQLKLLDPGIVLINGDMQTNSGTMFYEKNCFNDLLNMLGEAALANDKFLPAYIVMGNHDAKQAINLKSEDASITTLNEDNPVIETEGLSIMGVTDPVVTIWEPTLPADPIERQELLNKTGSTFADRICDYYESTGILPLIMGHEAALTSEATYRGCTWMALWAHVHEAGEVESMLGLNGQPVLTYQSGTASGIATGFSPYQAPERDASFMVMDLDTSVSPPRIIKMFSPTIYARDFSSKVIDLKLPNKSQPWSSYGWLLASLVR